MRKKLLIPDTVARELDPPPAQQNRRTPTCPSCGSKFSYDKARSCCSVCGLPDEIATLGPELIKKWKQKNHVGRALRQKKRAEADRSKVVIGGSAGRRKKKHGRPV